MDTTEKDNFWDLFKEKMINLLVRDVKTAVVFPTHKKDEDNAQIMNDLLKYELEKTKMPEEVAERVYAAMFGRSVEYMKSLKESQLNDQPLE